MLRFLFLAVLSAFIFTSPAYSANQCFDLFKISVPPQTGEIVAALSAKNIPPAWRTLYQEHKLQELVWAAREARREDIAQAAQKFLIETLETDTVVSKTNSIGGSTEVYLIEFASGAKGVFKPRAEDWRLVDQSFAVSANYKAEIAASLLDLFLDSRVVPITIEREIDGQRGSLQIFLPESPTLEAYGFGHIFELNNLYEMIYVDIVIGNLDRGARNILVAQGQAVAIDNGRAFPPMAKGSGMANMFNDQMDRSIRKYLDLSQLGFFQKIQKQVTRENLDPILSTYLSSELIDQIIDRKDRLLAAFEKKYPGYLVY
jgi:hypothetical protein